MNKTEQLERDVDILLNKISDSNLSKYDKTDLIKNYWALEERCDEISTRSDAMSTCIEKMRKLNGHFFHSKYSSEYSDIIDLLDVEECEEEEDSILDMMFPNRHDDDFDEDSMSYDSVFGDD